MGLDQAFCQMLAGPTGATGGEGTGSLLTHYIHSRNEKIVPPENQKGFR